MKYVRIMDGTVTEIIPEWEDTFPNVPVSARYSQGFLAGCMTVEDDAEVDTGMCLDPDLGTFSMPLIPEELAEKQVELS